MRNSQDCKPVRQNGTYTASRKHEVNLRRNRTLHFQVGLILAILIAIFFMEVKMPTQAYKTPSLDDNIEDVAWDQAFKPEEKKIVVKKKVVVSKPKAQQPEELTPVKDDTDLIDDFLPPTDPDQDDVLMDPNAGPDFDDTVDEVIEEVPFSVIEEVPLFPGCEGLSSNEERRDCMSSKIGKLVNRKFRSDIGTDLGLEGRNRIFVQFTIDKDGDVTAIKTRGPHTKLEKEAERVVKLLPKMTPGKQRGTAVGVIYTLPITLDLKQ